MTSHTRSDNLPTAANSKDLGTSSGVTCFLAGVGGNLSSSAGAPGTGNGTLYTGADARVYESGGHWWLEAFSGAGNGDRIKAKAACANTVSGRLGSKGWTTGSAPVWLDEGYAPNPARRCYLTGVSNRYQYYSDNNFTANNDQVRVWKEPGANGRWMLGGSGNATGSARCINVTGSTGLGGQLGDTSANPLEMAYQSFNPNVQCALTAVQGRFRSNDYEAGVFLTYNSGLSRYYLHSTGNRGVEAQCFW